MSITQSKLKVLLLLCTFLLAQSSVSAAVCSDYSGDCLSCLVGPASNCSFCTSTLQCASSSEASLNSCPGEGYWKTDGTKCCSWKGGQGCSACLQDPTAQCSFCSSGQLGADCIEKARVGGCASFPIRKNHSSMCCSNYPSSNDACTECLKHGEQLGCKWCTNQQVCSEVADSCWGSVTEPSRCCASAHGNFSGCVAMPEANGGYGCGMCPGYGTEFLPSSSNCVPSYYNTDQNSTDTCSKQHKWFWGGPNWSTKLAQTMQQCLPKTSCDSCTEIDGCMWVLRVGQSGESACVASEFANSDLQRNFGTLGSTNFVTSPDQCTMLSMENMCTNSQDGCLACIATVQYSGSIPGSLPQCVWCPRTHRCHPGNSTNFLFASMCDSSPIWKDSSCPSTTIPFAGAMSAVAAIGFLTVLALAVIPAGRHAFQGGFFDLLQVKNGLKLKVLGCSGALLFVIVQFVLTLASPLNTDDDYNSNVLYTVVVLSLATVSQSVSASCLIARSNFVRKRKMLWAFARRVPVDREMRILGLSSAVCLAFSLVPISNHPQNEAWPSFWLTLASLETICIILLWIDPRRFFGDRGKEVICALSTEVPKPKLLVFTFIASLLLSPLFVIGLVVTVMASAHAAQSNLQTVLLLTGTAVAFALYTANEARLILESGIKQGLGLSRLPGLSFATESDFRASTSTSVPTKAPVVALDTSASQILDNDVSNIVAELDIGAAPKIDSKGLSATLVLNTLLSCAAAVLSAFPIGLIGADTQTDSQSNLGRGILAATCCYSALLSLSFQYSLADNRSSTSTLPPVPSLKQALLKAHNPDNERDDVSSQSKDCANNSTPSPPIISAKDIVEWIGMVASSWTVRQLLVMVGHIATIVAFGFLLFVAPHFPKLIDMGFKLSGQAENLGMVVFWVGVLGVLISCFTLLGRWKAQLKFFPTDDSMRLSVLVKGGVMTLKAWIVANEAMEGNDSIHLFALVVSAMLFTLIILAVLTFIDTRRSVWQTSNQWKHRASRPKLLVMSYLLRFLWVKVNVVIMAVSSHIAPALCRKQQDFSTCQSFTVVSVLISGAFSTLGIIFVNETARFLESVRVDLSIKRQQLEGKADAESIAAHAALGTAKGTGGQQSIAPLVTSLMFAGGIAYMVTVLSGNVQSVNGQTHVTEQMQRSNAVYATIGGMLVLNSFLCALAHVAMMQDPGTGFLKEAPAKHVSAGRGRMPSLGEPRESAFEL